MEELVDLSSHKINSTMSHVKMKKSSPRDHSSQIFCANCCRPLFSLSHQHSNSPTNIILGGKDDDGQQKNDQVVIREISIDLACDIDHHQQQQQQKDPDITSTLLQQQQRPKPSININIQTALSSIYKLDYLNELNHLNLVDEKYDDNDGEEIGLCHICANELEILYHSYYKFNELRQLNSHLSRRIRQLDTIINSIRTAHHHHQDAAAVEDVGQNNDESVPVEICLDENEYLNTMVEENSTTTLSSCKENQFLSQNSYNRPNINNNNDEIKPSVKPQVTGPWVKLRRLTPQEILNAVTTTSTTFTTRTRRNRSNKIQNSIAQLTFDETDDDDGAYDDEYNNQDDPDFNIQDGDNIDNSSYHRRSATSKNFFNQKKVSSSSSENQAGQNDPCHCTICEAPFTNSDNLFNHLMSTHAAITLPRSWGCPLCDVVYVAKAGLETHIRGHLDYKPFTCPVAECQKPFTALSYMKRHMQAWHPDHSQSTYKPRSTSSSSKRPQPKNPSRAIIPSSRIPDPVIKFGRKRGPISFLKIKVDPPDPGPPAACSLCQQSFDNTANLVSHLYTVHRPQQNQQPPLKQSGGEEEEETAVVMSYVCPICLKAFTSEDTWKIHVHAHLQYKPYSCPRCVLKFSCKSYLRRHLANQSRSRCIALPCVFCGQHFGGLHYLDRHYKTEHVGRFPFSCSVCEKGAYNQKELQKHERTHLDKPYTCPKCDHHFVTEMELAVHVQSCPGRKGHVCDECGRAYTTREGMLKHVKIHRGETFYCEQCGKGFALLKSLKGHLKLHTDTRTHECQICFKTFSTSGNLKAHHEGIHSTLKSHLCQECGKGFGNSTALQRHQMAHSDFRPFICSWDGCGRSYKTADSLKYHQEIHTGLKGHVCSVCGRNFSQAQSLRKHLKSHRKNDNNISSPPRSSTVSENFLV